MLPARGRGCHVTAAGRGQRVALATHADASVYHASWVELLDVVGSCDMLAVDAPYSAKTHAGHGDGAKAANVAQPGYVEQGGGWREINYQAWSKADVDAFVTGWAPKCTGWFVTITDHVLAPEWMASLERSGRYVFAPMPYVAPGSRIRMMGDGPPCWACWIIVARPRSMPWSKWASAEALAKRGARPLRGAYVLPPGYSEELDVIGGKPLWLMERLLEDYSARGDLVVDPCCGAGTTLTAAQRLGRRAIGGDALLEHAKIAARKIRRGVQSTLACVGG